MLLKPRVSTIGIKIGKVIIIIEACSINIPKNRVTICMRIIMTIGAIEIPVVNLTRAPVAPVKANIWLNALAPRNIINIMTEIFKVPAIVFFTIFQCTLR